MDRKEVAMAAEPCGEQLQLVKTPLASVSEVYKSP